MSSYQPRSDSRYFYCRIGPTRAELYDHTFTRPVDTVILDTRKRTLRYHEDNHWVESDIVANTEEDFYQFVNQHSIFFRGKAD